MLSRIAFWLAKLDHVLLAAEVCNKIGDSKQLVDIYVQCKKWDDAFALAERQPQCVSVRPLFFKVDFLPSRPVRLVTRYNALVYSPYASWLLENDRFEDAQEAYCKAGMPLEAVRVLQVSLSLCAFFYFFLFI